MSRTRHVRDEKPIGYTFKSSRSGDYIHSQRDSELCESPNVGHNKPALPQKSTIVDIPKIRKIWKGVDYDSDTINLRESSDSHKGFGQRSSQVELGCSTHAHETGLEAFSTKFVAPSSYTDDVPINDKNCLTVSLSSLTPRYNCRVSLAKPYKWKV